MKGSALFLVLTVAAAGQAVKFDVASIRPAPSLASVMASHQMPHAGTHIDAGRVDIGFASLQDLICAAYKVKPYQVSGPDYLTTDRFDILATIPAGVSQDQVPEMLQSLLADRFGLVFHRASKDQSVYALVPGEQGAKLTPAVPEATVPAPAAPPPPGATTIDTGNGKATVTRNAGGGATIAVDGGPNGPMKVEVMDGSLHMVASHLTMPALADMLTGMMDRPVVDMTGLTGAYQVSLAVSQDDLMAIARATLRKLGMPPPPGMPAPAPGPSGHSIVAAVQQLGLKLDARTAPIADIVVDKMAQTPTAN